MELLLICCTVVLAPMVAVATLFAGRTFYWQSQVRWEHSLQVRREVDWKAKAERFEKLADERAAALVQHGQELAALRRDVTSLETRLNLGGKR